MLVTLVLFFLMEQYFFDFYHLKSSRDFLKQLPKDIYNFPQRYRDGDFQHVTLPYFLFQCKVFVYETVLDIVFNPPKLFLFIFVLYLFGW